MPLDLSIMTSIGLCSDPTRHALDKALYGRIQRMRCGLTIKSDGMKQDVYNGEKLKSP